MTDSEWKEYIDDLSDRYSKLALLFAASEEATGDEAKRLKKELRDIVNDDVGTWVEGSDLSDWPLNYAFDFVTKSIQHAYNAPGSPPLALEYIVAGPLWDIFYRHKIEDCTDELLRARLSRGFRVAVNYMLEPDRSKVIEIVDRW